MWHNELSNDLESTTLKIIFFEKEQDMIRLMLTHNLNFCFDIGIAVLLLSIIYLLPQWKIVFFSIILNMREAV